MSVLDHRAFLEQDFALVNPLQVDASQYMDLDTVRLVPEGMERHAHMMPLLVELNTLAETKRLDLLMRASNWARNNDMPLFSALLRGGSKGRVVYNLKRCMLISYPGVGRRWLRYHDPRVFRHLRWLLGLEQMAFLMGQIDRWTWYDPVQMRWDTHNRPDIVGRTPRFSLSTQQWVSLQLFDALNVCLRELAAEGLATDDSAAKAILEGLLQASRQGLTDDDDVRLFARQYEMHGPQWHQQERVLHCIERARTNQDTYFSACAEIGLKASAEAGALLDAERTNNRSLEK